MLFSILTATFLAGHHLLHSNLSVGHTVLSSTHLFRLGFTLIIIIIIINVIVVIVVVFSGAVTVLLKIFIPQTDRKPIINTLLIHQLMVCTHIPHPFKCKNHVLKCKITVL